MTKIFLSGAKFYILICCLAGVCNFQPVFAQVTGQQEIRWITVGALHNWFSNGGAEVEYGRRGRALHLITDEIDGLQWPAQYNNQDVSVGKALWIGTTNFDDPVSSVTYPYKVVCAGRLFLHLDSEIFPVELTMVSRFEHPDVKVDDMNAGYLDVNESVDEIDPGIEADRLIINKFHTTIGISCIRKILAFAQQYHDNYFIYEYVFKNTGIINDQDTTINRTLIGVVFHWQYRYSFAGESYHNGWAPTGAAWGLNTIDDVCGQDANHPGDFRAVWSYYGPVPTSPGVAEDIGLPRHSDGYILAGSHFAGVVVLHADKSPQDPSDDPSQPTTTRFMGSDQDAQYIDQFDSTLMRKKYVFMTAGHPAQTHAERIGKDPVTGWPTGFARNPAGLPDPGGYAAAQGFGPYTLAPGDSIRIVVAEAVAGIMKDREFVKTIANKWFSNSEPFILPNGSTTTDRNLYKNSWVFTGKDSLFQTFQRAIANFNSGFVIARPPPPPNQFEVISGSDKITLTWSNNAESWLNFDGYRIYRAEGRTDTTFDLIFECNKLNVVQSYDDYTARIGFEYYYYIQTKDDGSTNDLEPGVPLVSGKFFTMTTIGIPGYATGVGGYKSETVKNFSLSQNYPNPFNPITNITFYIPQRSFVLLKIFDLLGREVAKIVSGELAVGKYTKQWDASTIPSGVYFYRLQSGNYSETRKLVLLR